jgi:hypothetical protein
VAVQSGTLQLSGGGTSSGPFQVASGATLAFSAPYDLTNATVNNSGTVQVSTTVAGNAAIDPVGSGSVQVTGAGRLSAKHIRQNQLQISGGGRATIGTTAVPNAPDSTSRLNLLALGGPTPSGTLDLNNNSLILDYTGPLGNILSDVTAQIRSGRNGTDFNDQANWNGRGIITTKGRQDNVAAQVDYYNLAAINNADLDLLGIGSSMATFGGQAVTPNTVLVKYTYSGDADLNGVVDGDDYTYWLNGFLGLTDPAVQGWLRGDFNYDGVVDGDDYTQWLNAFLFAGPPLAGGGPSPVPEPATVLTLAIGALCLWWRARRR